MRCKNQSTAPGKFTERLPMPSRASRGSSNRNTSRLHNTAPRTMSVLSPRCTQGNPTAPDTGTQPGFSTIAMMLPLLGHAEPLAATISRPRSIVETLIGPSQTRNPTINDFYGHS